MKFLFGWTILLLGFLSEAHSAPTIVVTSSRNEEGGVRYFYTVSNWSGTDTTPTKCGDILWGHACVVLETVVFDSVPESDSTTNGWNIPLPGELRILSMGDVLRALNKQGVFNIPYHTSVLVQGYSYKAKCLKLQIATGIATRPITDCARLTAPPIKCDLYGKTNIDHNTLVDNALEGAQASTELVLSCTDSTSVTVKATRTNSYGVRLRSDGSLYSEIKVNDKDATNGIVVGVQNNSNTPLRVSSTLKARGIVAPGSFSGSTVIIVEPG